MIEVGRVVGAGYKLGADFSHRCTTDVVLAFIRDKDPTILRNCVHSLQAEIIRNLPALNAHIDRAIKVPLAKPILRGEVVNNNSVADDAVIKRKRHVQLVAPVPNADLVADLPVNPAHNLPNARRKRQGLMLNGVIG